MIRRRRNLQRHTELKQTPLPRGDKPLPRSELMPGRAPIKAKRPSRSTPERKARDLLLVRSGGCCEVCGNAPVREYQHRKPKARCSKTQLWDITNALHVCGRGNLWGCHGLIHQEPLWAVARGYTIEGDVAAPAGTPCLRRGEWVWLLPSGGVEPLSVDDLSTFGGAA